MTLYELNTAAYASFPDMNEKQLHSAKIKIMQYLSNHAGKFYLLLNNDVRYYTIFTFKNEYRFKDMAEEILDVAKYIGHIKSIEVNDNGMLEFWIMDNKEECRMFGFFNYDSGVITV